ncbi:hypothetical protein VP01_10192g1, partial [Puccinia sorghi]
AYNLIQIAEGQEWLTAMRTRCRRHFSVFFFESPPSRSFQISKKWHSYLLSLSETFEVLTDHNALKYFMSS